MELSHLPIWSNWFEETYAPHYSEVLMFSDEKVALIDTLNWVKTGLSCYVIVFGILLRISQFIVLPIVSIIGSPIFIIYHCI